MKKTVANIIIAYVFHAIIIVLDFLLMPDYQDGLMFTVFAADAVYLIYWIVLNIKSYMPWLVYLNFIIGSGVEAVLYWWGLTSTDGKPFKGGLVQIAFVFFLVIHAALLGIANLVLWALEIRRRKNR